MGSTILPCCRFIRRAQLRSASPRFFSTRTSVSQDEVSKFSSASKTWWDPRENPLVSMNPIRVKYMLDRLNENRSPAQQKSPGRALDGLRALDVGCGGGLLSESLARLGADVTAIDPSVELVEQAKLHAKLDRSPSSNVSSIDYRGGWTVEQLADENDGLFDVVCLLEVIEHVTDVHSVLSAASSLLKPDGTMFLSTVNRTLKSHALAIVGAEYIMRYLPPGTHDWSTFRSPEEISRFMDRAGLEATDVSGMVITSPPPIPGIPTGLNGNWNWVLDPDDVDVNWIGTYRHKQNADTEKVTV